MLEIPFMFRLLHIEYPGAWYHNLVPSGYGMLGTLLAYCLIPVGIGLLVVGWSKVG